MKIAGMCVEAATVKNGEIVFLSVPFFCDLTPSALALRREVFVEEQGFALEEEFDDKDISSLHLIGLQNGAVVATARLIARDGYAQLSRFAVRKTARGAGVGKETCRYAVKVANIAGYDKLYAEAQCDKIPFYRACGFKEYGDIFYDGKVPHKRMRNY